ncbi:MAG: hypothetical protein WCW52_10115 [Elusimicrobiales bacterium]|jgi:hypothetical protein
MKKTLLGLITLFVVNSVFAGEGRDWKSYYDNLLKGLKTSVQKKFESKNRISAVAAVRGAKQGSDADALYWKGGVSEKARKKAAEEKKAMTDAVQLVVDGKLAEGGAALEKFIKDNPDSIYAADAKEALSNLPKDAEKPAEPKAAPAKPPEEKTAAEEPKLSQAKPAAPKPAEVPDAEKGG